MIQRKSFLVFLGIFTLCVDVHGANVKYTAIRDEAIRGNNQTYKEMSKERPSLVVQYEPEVKNDIDLTNLEDARKNQTLYRIAEYREPQVADIEGKSRFLKFESNNPVVRDDIDGVNNLYRIEKNQKIAEKSQESCLNQEENWNSLKTVCKANNGTVHNPKGNSPTGTCVLKGAARSQKQSSTLHDNSVAIQAACVGGTWQPTSSTSPNNLGDGTCIMPISHACIMQNSGQ